MLEENNEALMAKIRQIEEDIRRVEEERTKQKEWYENKIMLKAKEIEEV